jgi:ABC-type glutathione transport system ATPase component
MTISAGSRRPSPSRCPHERRIEVAGLRREFRVRAGLFAADRHVIAVDDVTFSIPAGSVLGIVGESGCGKTTLARLILGLLAPTGGTALVDGKRLFELDRKARAAAHPARVPGPVRLAQSTPAHQGHRRAAARRAGDVLARRNRQARRANPRTRRAFARKWASACRRSSPAGSASAPRSRVRSCSSRAS